MTQYNRKTKSFHIHDPCVDVIWLIRALAAEVDSTNADIVEMAVRRYSEGR